MRFDPARLVFGRIVVLLGASCGGGVDPGGFAKTADDPSPSRLGPALLREITGERGLAFTHEMTFGGNFALPEIMGSGCAVFDADGDGRLDLYLVNAGETRGNGARNRLFLQTEGGRFVDATEPSGLGDRGYGMGVAVGDVDNDGDLDVYVGNWGPDALYLNRGDGTFADATRDSGISGDSWTSSVAFLDFDLDGWLDLYVVRYVQFDPTRECTQSRSRRDYCGPKVFRGEGDALCRNRGDGTFEDASERAGIGGAARNGLGVIVDDFDGDGWPDVYVANDGEANFLWMNQRDGRFVDEAFAMGVAVSGTGASQASMGIAFGDVDGDGDDDLFITNQVYECNVLYAREDAFGFSDRTATSGLAGPSRPHTGFGTVLFDADHDGDLDLAVANGRVEQAEGPTGSGPRALWDLYAEPNQLFFNDGRGFFSEASRRAGDFHDVREVSRGLAAADLDQDGDLDLVVTNDRGPARVYENLCEGGRWLRVRVRDPRLRREVFGARVVVRAGGRSFHRTAGSAVSYLTSVVDALHFGLGEVDRVEAIEVLWPGGEREGFPPPPVDSLVTLVRGEGSSR